MTNCNTTIIVIPLQTQNSPICPGVSPGEDLCEFRGITSVFWFGIKELNTELLLTETFFLFSAL
jgi:hypothetical protein